MNTENKSTSVLRILVKTSVYVLNLYDSKLEEFFLLKNCVGQISSTIELSNISFVKL